MNIPVLLEAQFPDELAWNLAGPDESPSYVLLLTVALFPPQFI